MTLAATGGVPGLESRCTVAGCTGSLRARGYCGPHYVRWQRHGDPLAEIPVARRAPDALTYRSAHRRVRAVRGPAAAQSCAECAGPAVVWSYDGTDPDERREPGRRRRYSLDPTRYRPRCQPCQRSTVTTGARVARLPEMDIDRAVRLYRAGASARGIGALLGVGRAAVLCALRAHGVAIRSPGRRRHSSAPTRGEPNPTYRPKPHSPP